MGYLEYLVNIPLAERITNAAVFEDVYRFLMNGSGRLDLRRADVAAVRVFLWNYQYRRSAVTGKLLRLASAVLDHCHRTGACVLWGIVLLILLREAASLGQHAVLALRI